MTVTAILSRKGNNVFTIKADTGLADAAKILVDRRIGALVVVGVDNRVDGIVNERNIVRAFSERGVKALAATVAEVMTRDVVTCGLADTVNEIMERMTDGKFRHLPVVEQGRLAGIVSIGDVVKWRLHEMKHESAAMRDYIRTA
jgi:CBS domain-containing protein